MQGLWAKGPDTGSRALDAINCFSLGTPELHELLSESTTDLLEMALGGGRAQGSVHMFFICYWWEQGVEGGCKGGC